MEERYEFGGTSGAEGWATGNVPFGSATKELGAELSTFRNTECGERTRR